MAAHNEFGQWGEDIAAQQLLQQGYQILARNFRHYKAEVDLIAQLDPFLVIIEVKTRSNIDFGRPEEFVSDKKQELLSQAAWAYAEQINWHGPIRFDIISVVGTPQVSAEIHHIEDAFFPMEE